MLVRSERQADRLRRDLFAETDAIRATADRRLGDTLARADSALANVEALRRDIKPVIENAAVTEQSAAALLDTYRALPSQMEDRFAPSWAKLEPEITCQLADGAGYGGCWHSRVTARLGEAANAGGVFTKKFPAFADSVTGIAKDVHTFTSKAVAPRGFWGTFKYPSAQDQARCARWERRDCSTCRRRGRAIRRRSRSAIRKASSRAPCG